MIKKQNKFLLVLIFQIIIICSVYYLLQNISDIFNSSYSLKFSGFVVELLSLTLIFFCCLVITSNIIYSFIISNILYFLFIAVSLVKIQYLSFPIVYYDFFQLNELFLNLNSIDLSFLMTGAILACLIVVVFIYAVIKGRNNQLRLRSFTALIIFTIIISSNSQQIKSYLSSNKIKYKWNSNIYRKAPQYGLLTFFVQSIYFSSKLEEPHQFSLIEAKNYLKEGSIKHQNLNNNIHSTPDNVIVLLVESFQNIKQLPWKTNIEITPTYNELESSGYSGQLISPVFGGRSINAEFELLTGFSSIFNPIGSIPYKDFIHHEIPSIARQFKQHGFTTNAIQAVKMKGYGYSSIYEHLGFDYKYSLSKFDENVELDPTRRYGSSFEISKKILELIKSQDKSFIFAFPNSSHSPWKIKDYPDNKIELLDNSLPAKVSDEIIAYYNSMIHIDELFKNLLTELDDNEKTIVLIVGDHQPALEINRNKPLNQWTFQDKINQHMVPYLFWSNYNLTFPEEDQQFTSMNLIGLTLFKLSNINPKGFYRFLNEVKRKFNSFSFVLLKDNQIINAKNLEHSETMKKYQFVQYMYLNDKNQDT